MFNSSTGLCFIIVQNARTADVPDKMTLVALATTV